MRLCTFQNGHRIGAGLHTGSHVYDLGQAYFRTFKRPAKFKDAGDFLSQSAWDRLGDLDLTALKGDRTVALPADDVRLKAPLLRPPKIICVGLNYKSHAAEQKLETPAAPLLFAKAPNIVIGPGDAVEIPRGVSEQVDYEVELGVVIGTPGFRISRESALDHVYGYTIVNDITARDVQRADRQWLRGKSYSTFCPMGPLIVTGDEFDPGNAAIKLRVNGELRQNSSTADLIFNVPFLVEYISGIFPLEAGDVISTGTPGGVGMFMNPPRWLKSGDRIDAEIEGIGQLSNVVK